MRLSDLKTQKKSPKTAPAPRAPATEKPAASTAPPAEARPAQAPPPDNLFGKAGSHTAPEAPKASAFRLSTLVKKKPESLPAVPSAQPMQAGHPAGKPPPTEPPPSPPRASLSLPAAGDQGSYPVAAPHRGAFPERRPSSDGYSSRETASLPAGGGATGDQGPARDPGQAEEQQSNFRLTGLFGKKPQVSSAEIPGETPLAPEAPKTDKTLPEQSVAVETPPVPEAPERLTQIEAPVPSPAPPEPESVSESSSEVPEEPAAAAQEEPLPEEIPDRFMEHPAGIYEAAKQLGIVLPVNKEAFKENQIACLTMIFQKCLQPALEKEIIWPMIKSMVSDISNLLAVNSSLLHLLRRQQAKSADQLLWHSFYTAIMAIDLAGQVANLDCSIEDIGGAALIHDIGLIGLPPGSATSIIEGPHLDEEHIQRGVELARRIGVPGEVLTMISHHCGRMDGSGYPPGLSARTFPRSSQIVAIADLFERTMIGMVKPKKKTSGQLAEFNIAQVFRKYRKGFDNELLKKMIDVIGFYPVGSFIELSNHALCRVIEQNRDFPLHPVVQVIIDGAGVHPDTEKLIDLKQVQLLSIIRQVDMPIDTEGPAL